MKLNIRYISLLLLLAETGVWNVNGQGKNASYEKYISQYMHLAVQEEKDYHIPASITLAQALLESNAGQSKLARQANNHFGIKCHSGWEGKFVYQNDEKKGECFRKYKHAGDSYKDHSAFLSERAHYAPLFSLKKDDYKGWAKGLQKCGYATDREYANKLIRIIETYQLYRYNAENSKKGLSLFRKISRPKIEQPPAPENIPATGEANTPLLRASYKIHGLIYVVARSGDSFEKIAEDMGFKTKELLKYNEAPADFPLRKGDIVYLEKKKRKADKSTLNHQVQSGESMHQISQRYGIRVRNLYELNGKTPDYVPTVGDMLKLR
jgi:LysM repeat protein